MGGLGNQMFQVAHAVAQGKKNNIPTKFRCESWTPMQGKQPSAYKDNIFKKLDFDWVETNIVRHNEFSWIYNDLIVDWSTSVEFYGYFQTSKHFLGYKEYIKNLFEPDAIFLEEIYEKYPKLKLNNTVSIHIRLGDYKENPHIHPSISVEYIQRALELIEEPSHIFIFSDDKNWVSTNLSLENSTVVNEEDWKELWMISLCQNNINSNSTFSWWGAFLNRHENKKVVVPSIWFGPGGPRDYQDLYERDWIKLEVSYDNGVLK
jgi:hypothetical protein